MKVKDLIETVQYNGYNTEEVGLFVNIGRKLQVWVEDGKDPFITFSTNCKRTHKLVIHYVLLTDWIIKKNDSFVIVTNGVLKGITNE